MDSVQSEATPFHYYNQSINTVQMQDPDTLCGIIIEDLAAEAMAQFPQDICFLKGFFSNWN